MAGISSSWCAAGCPGAFLAKMPIGSELSLSGAARLEAV
jgi:hypothetical protein